MIPDMDQWALTLLGGKQAHPAQDAGASQD